MKKLKQLLVLVSILSTYSYATCSKQEVMKLIEKGVSTELINSICETQTKSTTTVKPKSKWITPSNSTCRSKGGGRLYKGVCTANWEHAKNICHASGGRLPSKHELVAVISACGGNTLSNHSAWHENRQDPNYQRCYKQKGFAFDAKYYLTSSVYLSNKKGTWVVDFWNGDMKGKYKARENSVRCVSARQ